MNLYEIPQSGTISLSTLTYSGGEIIPSMFGEVYYINVVDVGDDGTKENGSIDMLKLEDLLNIMGKRIKKLGEKNELKIYCVVRNTILSEEEIKEFAKNALNN